MAERPLTIGVVGAGGTMGAQISAAAAYGGMRVVAYDQFPDALGRVDSSLERTVTGAALAETRRLRSSLGSLKGLLDKDTYASAESRLDDLELAAGTKAARDALKAKYQVVTTTKADDLAGCDALIEAVYEDLKVKEKTWREMDRVAPEAYKYTNSSSMGPRMFYGFVKDPGKVGGLHFFNPLANNPLVEVISGRKTSQETRDLASRIALGMKRVPVYCTDDSPGFIVNACLFSEFERALALAETGIADIPSIDRGMVFGLSHTIGPFALMDYVGLQVVYGAAKGIQDYLRQTAQKIMARQKLGTVVQLVDKFWHFAPCDYFRPSPLLEYLAAKPPLGLGLNGKEPEGLGFYNWNLFPRVNAAYDGKSFPDEKLFPKGFELALNPLVTEFISRNLEENGKYHFRRMKALMGLGIKPPRLVRPGLEHLTMAPKACKEAKPCRQ
jgi:3-hydroxybutyryl-CoA dehydrogenase